MSALLWPSASFVVVVVVVVVVVAMYAGQSYLALSPCCILFPSRCW